MHALPVWRSRVLRALASSVPGGNSDPCHSGKRVTQTFLHRWVPKGLAFSIAVACIFLLGCTSGGGNGGGDNGSGNGGAGAPASDAATAGSAQSAAGTSAFAMSLQVTVKDASGNLVPNVTVMFTAPSSSASGTFANGTATTTATTNSSGVAVASTFTANITAGSSRC
jgi:hypothetical protein